MTTPIDERIWINRAKRGDQAAFEAIVQRYERPLQAYIYRLTGDADDARDLTQDCFLRAYRALGKTSDDLHLSAWLFRIAANACLDVLRRRQRFRWVPWEGARHDHLLLSAPTDEPEPVAVRAEASVAVRRVLDRMSPRHRLALLLREYEGYSHDEIGQVLRVSRSAAKSALYRARREFRQLYEGTPGMPSAPVVGSRR